MDLPHPTVELRLPPDAQAPAEARRSVAHVASDLDLEARETLQLLVSELVTNCVRHGRLGELGWIDLRMESTPEVVRVSVTDPGEGFDWPAGPPRPGTPSGWGLYLVEQMADEWGLSRGAETQVWFEIKRSAA